MAVVALRVGLHGHAGEEVLHGVVAQVITDAPKLQQIPATPTKSRFSDKNPRIDPPPLTSECNYEIKLVSKMSLKKKSYSKFYILDIYYRKANSSNLKIIFKKKFRFQ